MPVMTIDIDTTIDVPRDIGITAAGACSLAAYEIRKRVRLRSNGGPSNKAHRQWLRDCADEYEAAGKLIQSLCDRS